MNCSQCGAELVAGAAFCPECGARTPSQSSPTAKISSAGQETVFLPESAMPMTPPPAAVYTPPNLEQNYTPAAAPLAPPPIPGLPTAQVHTPLPPPAVPMQPYMPPPPPAPTAYPVSAPTASPPNSTAAIVSLVTGICGWVIVPLICAIIAVVSGHMALNEIRQSDGRLGGRGMAIAGLILGYTQLGLTLVLCIAFAFLFAIAGVS